MKHNQYEEKQPNFLNTGVAKQQRKFREGEHMY
jgi:hypothetical protein